MFVGYADDHSRDVYRFLNIHAKRIVISRDVRWLNIIWKHYRTKSIYARIQVELFLDEEENQSKMRDLLKKVLRRKQKKNQKVMETTRLHKRN